MTESLTCSGASCPRRWRRRRRSWAAQRLTEVTWDATPTPTAPPKASSNATDVAASVANMPRNETDEVTNETDEVMEPTVAPGYYDGFGWEKPEVDRPDEARRWTVANKCDCGGQRG